MKDQCLRELLIKLETIYEHLYISLANDTNFRMADVINLASYLSQLSQYPEYREGSEELLKMLESHDLSSGNVTYMSDVVYRTRSIVNVLGSDLRETDEDIFDSLKQGCADVKDKISGAIPQQIKDSYAKAAAQLKAESKAAENKLKHSIINWLSSDDN